MDFNGSNQQHTEVPAEVFSNPDIERLSLSHNQLSSMPDTMTQLTKLRYLSLKANNFREIPQCLTLLPSLQILDMNRNKITQLPVDMGNLMKLQVLSLSRNRITYLPQYIADMSDLTTFKIDGNPIETVPDIYLKQNDDEDEGQWLDRLKQFLKEQPVTSQEDRTLNVLQSTATLQKYLFTKSRMQPELFMDTMETVAVSGVAYLEAANELLFYTKNLQVVDGFTHIMSQCDNSLTEFVHQLQPQESEIAKQSIVVMDCLLQLINVMLPQLTFMLRSVDVKVQKQLLMRWYCATLDIRQIYQILDLQHQSISNATTPLASRLATPTQMEMSSALGSFNQRIHHQQSSGSGGSFSVSNVSTSGLTQLARQCVNQALNVIMLIQNTLLNKSADSSSPSRQQRLQALRKAMQHSEQAALALDSTSKEWDKQSADQQLVTKFQQDSNAFILSITAFSYATKNAAEQLKFSRQVVSALQSLTKSTKNFTSQLRNMQ